MTFHLKPDPEFFNRRFSARKASEVVHNGNWLLLTGTGTCTSVLLQKVSISVWEGKVSPTCYLCDTGFRMVHLSKLVNTIEGIIKFFGVLTRASFELLDKDLQVLINQLRGILHRLRRTVEESQVGTSPHPTYCRRRRNRLIFSRPSEVLRENNELVPGEGQIELVPIARLRIHLRTQPESVDCQVLEPVVEISQTQVEETDTGSDSDLPDLIDSDGNIVN